MLFISSLAFSAALLFVLSSTSSIPLSRNFRVSFFLSRCLIFKVRCHRFSHGWKHIIALSKLIVNRNFSTFWNFFLTFSFVSRCLADSFDIIPPVFAFVKCFFRIFSFFFVGTTSCISLTSRPLNSYNSFHFPALSRYHNAKMR